MKRRRITIFNYKTWGAWNMSPVLFKYLLDILRIEKRYMSINYIFQLYKPSYVCVEGYDAMYYLIIDSNLEETRL